MGNRRVLFGIIFAFSAIVLGVVLATTLRADEPGPKGPRIAAPLGSAFTYQGQLLQSGSPVNGACDFQFRLYDASSGGSQVGPQVDVNNLAVNNGLFTALLDFGASPFTGEARWLEVGVRCPAGSGSFTTLSPRQGLTPVPYALWAAGGAFWSLTGNASTTASNFLGTTDNVALEVRVNNARALRVEPGTTPNLIGGWSGNSATSGVVGATVSGGGTPTGCGSTENDPCPNRVTDNYGTIGGGANNQAGNATSNTSDATYATVGGGWGNTASGGAATVGGGDSNTASGGYATVGGGWVNTASGWYATVGGGWVNTASGRNATVGGGYSNTASGWYATVGGGERNTASSTYATVGGGRRNTAGPSATVGGGEVNTASGSYATVGGGGSNTASGYAATVPGGIGNQAMGDFSFAAGRRAHAHNQGSFVWGDSTDAEIMSSANDQATFRTSGGFRIFTNSAATVGVQVAPGGNSWSAISDRAVKDNLTAVDTQDVLARLLGVPIYRYTLKSQDPSIEHMGPVAQDFWAAFGLGEDERYIGGADADGVLMAALQGLAQRLQEKEKELANQRQEIVSLKQEIADLKARLGLVEALLAALLTASRP